MHTGQQFSHIVLELYFLVQPASAKRKVDLILCINQIISAAGDSSAHSALYSSVQLALANKDPIFSAFSRCSSLFHCTSRIHPTQQAAAHLAWHLRHFVSYQWRAQPSFMLILIPQVRRYQCALSCIRHALEMLKQMAIGYIIFCISYNSIHLESVAHGRF